MNAEFERAKKEIIDIIVRRDGESREDTEELFNEAIVEIQACAERGDLEGAYDAMSEWFGLEPDFLDSLIF